MSLRTVPLCLAALAATLALGAAPAFAAQPAKKMPAAQTQARADIVDTAVAAGQFKTLAAALQAAGPQALVVAGPRLSAQAHAAVHALNERLGAPGRTLDYLAPLGWADDSASLAELVEDMNAGQVRVLLVLEANPTYDTPGELGFRAALARVANSVHCGTSRDETAHACKWHLPLSHAFEQWSDLLAHDGTATLVQPLIAPLYDTRSLHEILAIVTGEAEREGHAIVRSTWRPRTSGDFEEAWRAALRQGRVDGSAPAPLSVQARAPRPLTAGGSANDALVAVFAADAATGNGQHANNAWLQELPRPFTRHTWDNAALLAAETARRFGLATGDTVRLSAGARSLTAPVWVQAGHAAGVITLPLGYGRTHAGRVGDTIGFDAYAFMPVEPRPLPVALERLEHRHEFAVTQHTLDPSGREPARLLQAGTRLEPGPELPSLYPPTNDAGPAWAMTIDLDACIGCSACTIACQAENNIPVVGRTQVARGRVMHWIRVDAYHVDEADTTIFQPVPCMHCERAPCELVCPVGATMHDSDGLNVQVYNRCIGTRFCSNNCPYKVRRFNFLQFSDDGSESLKGQRNPDVTVRRRGVMEKCNYCLQRVARARQHAQRSGVALADGDVVTACQAVCPTQAIHFGNLHDPTSDVAQLRDSPRHYALLGELNTRPRTTYLARLRRPQP